MDGERQGERKTAETREGLRDKMKGTRGKEWGPVFTVEFRMM